MQAGVSCHADRHSDCSLCSTLGGHVVHRTGTTQPDVPFRWQDMASISEGKQEDGGTELSPPVFAMRRCQGLRASQGRSGLVALCQAAAK